MPTCHIMTSIFFSNAKNLLLLYGRKSSFINKRKKFFLEKIFYPTLIIIHTKIQSKNWLTTYVLFEFRKIQHHSEKLWQFFMDENPDKNSKTTSCGLFKFLPYHEDSTHGSCGCRLIYVNSSGKLYQTLGSHLKVYTDEDPGRLTDRKLCNNRNTWCIYKV